MPDASAGEAAFLNGEEIINNARTIAYLNAGYGPPGLNVIGGCACPNLRELIECDEEPYSTPVDDPAPWYDVSVPESGDFSGFYVETFEGLGSTFQRSSFEKITGGSALGRLRAEARTMTWKGYLFGRSECAVQYGLRWLTAQLRGAECACGGEDLDLLICCPSVTGATPVTGCLPSQMEPFACPPFVQPNAFRTLKNVGLFEGPTILSQRQTGCGSGCTEDRCEPSSLIIEIEFSLLAGNPFLYGCPVCLCVEESFPDSPDPTDLFIKVIDGGEFPAACLDPTCPPPADITADPGCRRVTLPTIPEFTDRCFCDAIDPVQFCCAIPADSFGEFFEGVPVIEIFSGSTALRSTTIRFYSNPLGSPCCDVADPCFECDSIRIRYIPPLSTLTIDGQTRKVTLQGPGMGAPVNADSLTVTPFSWPILQCIDHCICIETDGAVLSAADPCLGDSTSTGAHVSVAIFPREL